LAYTRESVLLRQGAVILSAAKDLRVEDALTPDFRTNAKG
jgi:hypothetical protein